jgi:hypothetical protein
MNAQCSLLSTINRFQLSSNAHAADRSNTKPLCVRNLSALLYFHAICADTFYVILAIVVQRQALECLDLFPLSKPMQVLVG